MDMESPVHSQVVFIDVPRSYPLHTDVACCYKLTGDLKPNPKDWIGIYKVGWDSVQKYACYEWTKPCLEYKGFDPLVQQIVFKEYYLPKDDMEFYQFCYVDCNHQVRGASTPFCFQNAESNSTDCSILVISTQEQIEQMEKEKEAIMTEMDQLKEINKIVKKELDESLQEILRLRMFIDNRESSTSVKCLLKEQPESAEQDQPSLSDSVAEATPEQKSLNLRNEKHEKALLKITLLKKEKRLHEQALTEKDAEISELRTRARMLEQDNNSLQDQLKLLQVDMQSNQKEKERLQAEKEGIKYDLERLQQENKALHATFSKQGPPEGGESDTKILSLTNELREVRGALHKEILRSKEANKRADKTDLELKDLKTQLEKKLEFDEDQRRISEQTKKAESERLGMLSEENRKLKSDIEKLQMIIFELSSRENMSNTEQQLNPHSHQPTAPINSPEQPQSHLHYYEDISEPFEYPTNAGNKVCRHCKESFPDITEDELVTHEQSHKVCPFCTLICDECEQQEFEDHVYSHEE